MSITHLTINKHAEDKFTVSYTKEVVSTLQDEQVDVIRFTDDLVDVLLRYKNHMEVLSPIDGQFLVAIHAGSQEC